MSTVKTADLKVGMKVTKPIFGKKGDIKVNSGEVLSKLHVDSLNKWNNRKDKKGNVTNSVDAANPSGIEVSNTLGSGNLLPGVIDNPQLSPIIEAKSKEKLSRSMRVTVDFDKDGNIIRQSEIPLEPEEVKNESTGTIKKAKTK